MEMVALISPIFLHMAKHYFAFLFHNLPGLFQCYLFFDSPVSNISVEQGVFQCSFQKMTNHGKVTKGLGDIIGEMTADDQVSSNLTQD